MTLFWMIVGILFVCYVWFKVVDGGQPRGRDTDKTQVTATTTGIGEAARGVSRLMSDVGRGVSHVPQFLDDLDKFVAESAAKQREVTRKETSSFGRILRHKQLVLPIVMKSAKIFKRLDSDPLLAQLFEKNRRLLESTELTQKDHQIGHLHIDMVPEEYRSLRFWSIPFLLHFTRASNLPSILERGIVPISMCREMGIVASVNDIHRFDRRRDSSSFSIGHPNHRMLWKYRQIDPAEDWVVLAIDPSVIWRKDCAFCPCNAADRRVSSRDISSLKGPGALEAMIGGNLTGDLLPYEPADDQAEILVFDIVDPNCITGIFFLNDATRTRFDKQCGSRASFNAYESEAVFAARSYAKNLSGNAALLDDYQKSLAKITEALKSDPGLAPFLNQAIAEFLSDPAVYAETA